MRSPVIVTHFVRTPQWRARSLRVAVISDLHVVSPWASLAALDRVVTRINALLPDIVMIPGDFLADPKLLGRRASAEEIVAVLEKLAAPMGVHATLGNHDWAHCTLARETRAARNSVAEALEASRISHYQNSARDLGAFWLAGVDSIQGAGRPRRPEPHHDLNAALARVPNGADVILMAHEPDLWVDEQPDVALTVSGHTHAGQIVLAGWRPLTPSRHGARYAHGLFRDRDRTLVVSAGLGYSGLPLRLGAPPEITVIELSSG